MSYLQKPRRALLLANRFSRSGAGGIGPALDRLRAGGVTLFDGGCDSVAEVTRCILAHRNKVDCVIVSGGDGSLNAAGPGLLATALPLGVLPLGTANDFARSVGLPLEPAAAAAAICEGATRSIDVGEVNGRVFFNVASVGLAADLAQRLTADSKRRFGRLSYALSASHVLMEARPFHATLLLGEQKIMVRTMQIAVGNGRYYGGGNIVASDAQIDDGHLDLYSLEFSQVWRMALMVRSFKTGSHGAVREVRTARGASFEVITRKPRPVNADGELVTQTPARFTQRLQAITVYVPGAAA